MIVTTQRNRPRRAAAPHTLPTARHWPDTGILYAQRMTDTSVADDAELADIVALLDDDHVRGILAATSAEPLSASALSDRCGVSTSAIYRRVDRLVDTGLLEEQTRPRSDGHHDTVYVASLKRFELVVRDGELTWTVERTEVDVADELTRLWRQF